MTRSIFAVFAVGAFITVITGPGCKATGVGDPCTPEQEYLSDFKGFDEKEVNVESKSFQCQTRLCLVNHFRGRVSCPYGQDQAGNAPVGSHLPMTDPNFKYCVIPGTQQQIVPNDPKTFKQVPPQLTGPQIGDKSVDRTANKAVYCSCRCQNVDGKTDDGANYCTCPDGFVCAQLVTTIGATDTGLTGGYCIKTNTGFDLSFDNQGTGCDPQNNPCANSVY